MSNTADQHREDVRAGERFEFGENWRRFLVTLNDHKIALAEESMARMLGCRRLDGKTFLDIGSGSGLFSLVARRLGAVVRSFDYDPQSVACTKELRSRFFPEDEDWVVEQGSILDQTYLDKLGTHDVVYSWGVLHHTGAMHAALNNAKRLVAMGGLLFIAIYNELGEVTDHWRAVKRNYNRLPRALRQVYALSIIAADEWPRLLEHLKRGEPGQYVKTWKEYDTVRGMSRWHDWIDWIGGYPYECATVEEIIDEFGKDGFRLTGLADNSSGYGCNEFVFRREAGLGVAIEHRIGQSRFVARAYGHRVSAPFLKTTAGYVAMLPAALQGAPADELVVFCDAELVGTAAPAPEPGMVVVAPGGWAQARGDAAVFRIVRGRLRRAERPFRAARGRMFVIDAADLAQLAENAPGRNRLSPVFVFEGTRQLQYPRALHDDIARYGNGRFSHWDSYVAFASSDGSDPNKNGRDYRLVIARE
jgi:2-polyprenyl-3-methyl-5-hydroxy-6-metoxy-1,4-benzoquinol methylase